ncbi:hypothetical protein J4470_01650 [Candidatus Woesearchaeota archaeon]|nr:hypothetical protein [Candidatus Woesearchaeota archaeon]
MKIERLSMLLLVAALAVVLFNSFQISQMKGSSSITGAAVIKVSEQDVIPKGVPKIYGSELGVSFDDISSLNQQLADATINKLGALDRSIELRGGQLQRYIAIASKISCEYCCGAASIIFSNGQAACGCAHSYAMRGVAKYLIENHGDEYSDDEVLEELGKWKTLFFPSQLSQKAEVLSENGIELNYINLASNKYRGIEQGAGGGMVGGC